MKTKKRQNFGLAILVTVIVSCDNAFVDSILPSREPTVPVITGQPQSAAYNIGDTAIALSVVASVSDKGVISYQWYSNTKNSVEGGTLISTSTNNSYMPPTDKPGILYYYVVVINTLYGKIAQAESNTAGIGIDVFPVTITGLSVDNKIYDGTTTAVITGTAELNGVLEGDDVNINAGTAAFSDKNAGTGKNVTFSGWSITGADAGKYLLLAQPTAMADITSKPVTITGLSVSNKVYDGTITAMVTGVAVIDGKIASDDVSAIAGTAVFTDTAVGVGKTVTFNGWSLTGADACNYTLSAQPESVTANIQFATSIIDMVLIPAGTFIMGSPGTEPNRFSDETQHSVTLTNSFFMGKYEVTQEQYEAVMGTNPSSFNSSPQAGETQGKRPVEMVTWYDAVEFCNKLSALEGLQEVYAISGRTPASGYPITSATVTAEFTKNGYRLPTEAQWEYACRAGTTTAYNTGDTISDNTGWYRGNSENKTHEVGKKSANAWGLYDMHGNVYEWCWDWYGTYPSTSQTDPMGASSGSIRVGRGGSWPASDFFLRSAYRSDVYGDPSFRSFSLGFRLVCP